MTRTMFILSSLTIAILAFGVIACDSTTSVDQVEFDYSDIEGVTIESYGVSKAGGEQYLVSLKVNEGVNPEALPDGFSLANSDGDVILEDDGNGVDEASSDYTYTALVDESDLPPIQEQAGKKGLKIICELDFAKPGEEICGRTCPDKSMLGFDTIICVCLHNCRVEVDFF